MLPQFRKFVAICCVAALLGASGCLGRGGDPDEPGPPRALDSRGGEGRGGGGGGGGGGGSDASGADGGRGEDNGAVTSADPLLDAAPLHGRLPSLRIFVIDVPRGQISGNAGLWRRIDEQRLDPGVYDVLWANGVRVGAAPLAELDHVRSVLGIETAQRLDIMARNFGRQAHELPLEREVGEKTLFWFDGGKRHHGRTFQRCETLLSLSFEAARGQAHSVRVSMSPVVRALDKRIVVTPGGGDYEVSEVRDTTLLDLNLRADVPVGEFLIIAPSDELRWETCLGRQFFCFERDGQLFERAYVIIPGMSLVKLPRD